MANSRCEVEFITSEPDQGEVCGHSPAEYCIHCGINLCSSCAGKFPCESAGGHLFEADTMKRIETLENAIGILTHARIDSSWIPFGHKIVCDAQEYLGAQQSALCEQLLGDNK